MGERAQSTVLTRARAPPRRPARPRWDFIFNLSMRESKAWQAPAPCRRMPSPCRRKKALSTRCQLISDDICWPLLPTFLGGLGIRTQPNKGRTSPWQMPAGRSRRCKYFLVGFSWTTLMLLCTRVPKLHAPAAELWKELVLDVHGTCHLDKHGRRCM